MGKYKRLILNLKTIQLILSKKLQIVSSRFSMSIAEILINWYSEHKRNLPWRTSIAPYNVWISEIILQQTRVDQGLPFYYRFLERFPNIKALSNANEDELLVVWQGLGYYSRARNMYFTAKHIVNNLNGKFPESSIELLKLKGIGHYTAAAIASVCFSENIAAIDGNVYRVITRLFDIDNPIDSKDGQSLIKKISSELIQNIDAGIYNQAIMDFGATQCTPKNPNCTKCPLIAKCLSYEQNTILQRPVKNKKNKQTDRFFTYIIIYNQQSVLINKRNQKDIWKGLFEFPMIETNHNPQLDQIINNNPFNTIIKDIKNPKIEIRPSKLHILSHQRLHANFILLKGDWQTTDQFTSVPIRELKNYAFPILLKPLVDLLISLTT